jgi:hypothetical protein
MNEVVLAHLRPDFAQHRPAVPAELLLVATHPELLAELKVIDGDGLFKEAGVDEVPKRLAQAHPDPRLIFVHPHDAVTQVVVEAEHAGVGVVQLVVGALPQVGRRCVIPLPSC